MKIVHIASEISPFAKAGGLADVVSNLANYLSNTQNVEIIIPKYPFLSPKLNIKKIKSFKEFNVFQTKIKSFTLTLIENKYFKRKKIYGYKDDEKRFLCFSNQSLKYLLDKNQNIDILHLHDWHSSICSFLYKNLYKKKGLQIKKIVLTIHNIKYQGTCNKKWLLKIIKPLSTKVLKEIKSFFKINILKAGIIYSDKIVTVSPTYGKEIFLKKYAYGLHKTVQKNKKKILGILNGINTDIWSPNTDKKIKYTFSKNLSIEKILEQKEKNKKYLQKILKLKEEKKPIFCVVSRLVFQKGVELILYGAKKSIEKGQFILLGSSDQRKIEKKFFKLKKLKNASINLTFDESLAHLIYCSSDFILIPSRFEPCGLTQMIAQCYGTIPIARKTGGLADSIIDKGKNMNGFLFEKYKKKSMLEVLKKAANTWYNNPQKIKLLIKNAMNVDNSFKNSCEKYLQLYKSIISH